MITPKGNATKAMFNAIAEETLARAKKWFMENPDEPYCYWAKDTFIKIADKDDADILKSHPEIEDINDHTTCMMLLDTLILEHFCPKLKAGIQDMWQAGVTEGNHWKVCQDLANDNFVVYVK